MKFCFLILFWTQVALSVEPIYQWQTLRSGDHAGELKIETRKLLQVDEALNNVKLQVQSRPIGDQKITKVVIIGDTGCRLKDSKKGGSYQNCADPKKWPFPALMQQVQAEKPDLIIHLGDYHYRESCANKDKCNEYSKATGYTWVPWDLDFFAPAKSALKDTPWIFVRGNHEECKRAGLGWTHLLAKDANGDCQKEEATEILEGPTWVFINFDSTWISDFPDFSANRMNALVKELDGIAKRLPNGKTVYMVTHKPILGVAELRHILAPVNLNFREAFGKSTLKSKVTALFSGHVHNSQMTMAEGLPIQVMEGNSGTILEPLQQVLDADGIKSLGLQDSRQISSGFGYVVLQLSSRQEITFKDLKGQIAYQCDLRGRATNCFPKK